MESNNNSKKLSARHVSNSNQLPNRKMNIQFEQFEEYDLECNIDEIDADRKLQVKN